MPGETGTGKETIADCVFDVSDPVATRCARINCAGLEGQTQNTCLADQGQMRSRAETKAESKALTAGIPLELVQKVTGHKTAEVVLKHYFQPGRQYFGNTLRAVMPKLLPAQYAPESSSVAKTSLEEPKTIYEIAPSPASLARQAIALVEQMNTRNWKSKREEALPLMQQAARWLECNILHEPDVISGPLQKEATNG